jgi:hypothetical protein
MLLVTREHLYGLSHAYVQPVHLNVRTQHIHARTCLGLTTNLVGRAHGLM